jgi:hypothetical protein
MSGLRKIGELWHSPFSIDLSQLGHLSFLAHDLLSSSASPVVLLCKHYHRSPYILRDSLQIAEMAWVGLRIKGTNIASTLTGGRAGGGRQNGDPFALQWSSSRDGAIIELWHKINSSMVPRFPFFSFPALSCLNLPPYHDMCTEH